MSYFKHINYRFEVRGKQWAACVSEPDCIEVEETRKNGQEDCHAFATFVRDEDGTWAYEDEHVPETIAYHLRDPQELPAYLNKHPLPAEAFS